MRAVVEGIYQDLLSRHTEAGHVHLNDLAEVIGPRAITPDEVEELVTRLEAAGLRVGEELDARDVRVMREVLTGARRLRARLGRRPSVDEIAADTGHPGHVVRRALEHGAAAATVRRVPS